MQSQALQVIRNDGMETVRGRKAYVYGITVNRNLVPDAPQVIVGRIWIDAQTFLVQRILWHIAGTQGTDTIDDTLQFDLFDQGADIHILAPHDAHILHVSISNQ